MDPRIVEIVAGAGALLCLVLAAAARRSMSTLRERVSALEQELARLRSEAMRQEYRVERFDVLWYPTLTAAPETKTITQVTSGVPHCKSCAQALSLLPDHSWSCGRCRAAFPATLADVFVTDTVVKEAIRFFLERNPGFRLQLKK